MNIWITEEMIMAAMVLLLICCVIGSIAAAAMFLDSDQAAMDQLDADLQKAEDQHRKRMLDHSKED